MATLINRYSLNHEQKLENVIVLAPKYCELCGLPFFTNELDARAPGDLISIQRAAGRRTPIVCTNCQHDTKKLLFMQDEAKEILRIAEEVRAYHDARIHDQVLEEQRIYQQRRAMRREKPKDDHRRMRFAKWRAPLMQALQEKNLSVREIATIIGVQPGAPASQIYIVPSRVRSAGIPLVVVGKRRVEQRRGPKFVRLFGLSTNPELAPLTPPKDEVTHQFMREVQA